MHAATTSPWTFESACALLGQRLGNPEPGSRVVDLWKITFYPGSVSTYDRLHIKGSLVETTLCFKHDTGVDFPHPIYGLIQEDRRLYVLKPDMLRQTSVPATKLADRFSFRWDGHPQPALYGRLRSLRYELLNGGEIVYTRSLDGHLRLLWDTSEKHRSPEHKMPHVLDGQRTLLGREIPHQIDFAKEVDRVMRLGLEGLINHLAK
jgi:hypothetical protein